MEEKRVLVVLNTETIGYFIGDDYYDNGNHKVGRLRGNVFTLLAGGGSSPSRNRIGEIKDNKLIRGDGMEFLLIKEADTALSFDKVKHNN